MDNLEFLAQQPGRVVLGAAAVTIGVIVCFFGRRILRPTLAVAGFAVGFQLGTAGLSLAEEQMKNAKVLAQDQFKFDFHGNAAKAIPFILGGLSGIVFMSLVQLAMYLIAAAAGVTIFSVVRDTLKESSMKVEMSESVRMGIMVGSALVPLLLVSFLEHIIVSAATSSIGAALVMVGIDMFVDKKFLTSIREVWSTKVEEMQDKVQGIMKDRDILYMCCGFVALATVGTLYQWRFGPGRK